MEGQQPRVPLYSGVTRETVGHAMAKSVDGDEVLPQIMKTRHHVEYSTQGAAGDSRSRSPVVWIRAVRRSRCCVEFIFIPCDRHSVRHHRATALNSTALGPRSELGIPRSIAALTQRCPPLL